MYKCFVGMRGRSGGVSSAWWHVRTAFEVSFVELVVERICVWCLVFSYLWDLDKQEHEGVGDA